MNTAWQFGTLKKHFESSIGPIPAKMWLVLFKYWQLCLTVTWANSWSFGKLLPKITLTSSWSFRYISSMIGNAEYSSVITRRYLTFAQCFFPWKSLDSKHGQFLLKLAFNKSIGETLFPLSVTSTKS